MTLRERPQRDARPLTLETALERLSATRPDVADEIQALQAIFGDDKIRLHAAASMDDSWTPDQTLRLALDTTLPSVENVDLELIVSLRPEYPTALPPQLQLAGKYIGDHLIDSALFGAITRLYMQENSFRPGEVAIFEGVERAREEVERYYIARTDELASIEAGDPHATQDDIELAQRLHLEEQQAAARQSTRSEQLERTEAHLPAGRELYTSEPIVDRKSVFVGHAFEVRRPAEVQQVVGYLLADKKIAKAHHPAMLAYRCTGTNGVIHQDNDDDGETAAGSRLAHLLQILDIDNVLVVVTRWYGGVHLGSDRFKHINQAARDALLAGGFLVPSTGKK